MKYKHFTFDERNKMEEYLKSGMTKGTIAQLLHKSVKTIYNEFERGKIEVNENGLVTAQYSASKAEERYQTWLHSSKNSTLYNSTIAEIEKLLHEGYSPVAIAKKLGISKATVHSYIKKGKVPDFEESNLKKNKVKMFSNGNIIIPKWLRTEMNIEDGQELEIYREEDIICLRVIEDERK